MEKKSQNWKKSASILSRNMKLKQKKIEKSKKCTNNVIEVKNKNHVTMQKKHTKINCKKNSFCENNGILS